MSGRREVLLTDEQWEKVKRFILKVEHPKGGRPRTDDRSCFEAILWVPKKRRSQERFAREISFTQHMLEKIGIVGR